MISIYHLNRRLIQSVRTVLFTALLFTGMMAPRQLFAHQTPTTMILLDASPGSITMELQLPLSELELAFGHAVTNNPETLVERLGPQLKEYLAAHIHPFVTKENPWTVEVISMQVGKGEQLASGPPFRELIVHLQLRIPAGVSARKWTLDYDVIMHQVMNHAALVSIRNDWENGQGATEPVEAGVIHWDMKDNMIYPLEISLQNGSWWKGFTSMLLLGMEHIKEGTDHILFLLVLLLPAMLLTDGKKWGGFGGAKYSMRRLLAIITSFTIGHSITLLIGALGWVHFPAQPIEILIAFSILVSAVHAIYPIFPGKEIYIATVFGLVHGLAFATVLANLHLGAGPMAVSILGFNLGIELMQLTLMLLIMPWLILLSQVPAYAWIRITGAVLAGIAALGWIAERVSGNSNPVSVAVLKMPVYALWGGGALALLSLILYFLNKYKDNAVLLIKKEGR